MQEYLSHIDFTEGFSSWHIKWPVKNVQKTRRSLDFETSTYDFRFKWYLMVDKDDRNNEIYFGLYAKELKSQTPVVFRLALQIPGRAPFFNSGGFRVFSPAELKIGSGFRFPMMKARRFVGSGMVLHCWIDIPKSIGDIRFYWDSALVRSTTGSQRRWAASGVGGYDIGSSLDKASSDVTLLLLDEDGEAKRKYYCHKDVLGAHSELYNTAKLSKKTKEYVIKVDSMDPKAMETILDYIYKQQFPDKICYQLPEIARFAEKYNMPGLARKCALNFITYYTKDWERLKQLRLTENCRNMDQLRAVCVAALCTNLKVFEDREEISAGLMAELMRENARRQMETTQIDVSSYGNVKILCCVL